MFIKILLLQGTVLGTGRMSCEQKATRRTLPHQALSLLGGDGEAGIAIKFSQKQIWNCSKYKFDGKLCDYRIYGFISYRRRKMVCIRSSEGFLELVTQKEKEGYSLQRKHLPSEAWWQERVHPLRLNGSHWLMQSLLRCYGMPWVWKRDKGARALRTSQLWYMVLPLSWELHKVKGMYDLYVYSHMMCLLVVRESCYLSGLAWSSFLSCSYTLHNHFLILPTNNCPC